MILLFLSLFLLRDLTLDIKPNQEDAPGIHVMRATAAMNLRVKPCSLPRDWQQTSRQPTHMLCLLFYYAPQNGFSVHDYI